MPEPEQLANALGDRYRIDRELGRGGMAVVYLAEDIKHERMVALKVLRPELTAALGAERFLREIKITARLDHPHILPLLDSGEAGDLLYYVMPYVEGESLRDRMGREGQLPLEDALLIAREVADALGYAHSRDVVHRDIKPENVLLSGGHARVADFGIARAITAAAGGRLTETGVAIGTPLYMSPEQLSGEGSLDGRSDLYSLGAVLYEMLAGEPPYTGPTAQAILARKSSGEIPSISTIREAVPPGVEAAVLRALAKTPADRFVTAQQFSQALVPSTESSPRSSPQKRSSTIKLAVAAVAILVVVSLGATGRLPWMVRPAAAEFFNERDPVVVAEFENETDQPAMGLALRDAVMTDLDQSPYVDVVDRAELASVLDRMRLADTVQLGAAVATEIARREGYPAVVAGSVTQLGAGYQLSVRIIEASTGDVAIRLRKTAADGDEVVDAVEKLVRLARRHLGESLGSVRRSEPLPAITTASLEALQMSAEGTVYGYRGEYDAAISLLEQAVRIDTAFAGAYRGLSIYYQNLGNPGAAQANADLAYRFSERLTTRERYLVSSTYHNRRGRLDSVAFYHVRLLELSPEDYTALNNLGDTYERMGRYQQALELYRRAADIIISSSGLVNVSSAARTLGLHELADSVNQRQWEDYATAWSTWSSQYMNALYALDESRMEQIAGEMSLHELPFPRGYGRWARSGHRAMGGQLEASLALADTSISLLTEAGSQSIQYWSLITATWASFAAGTPERARPFIARVPDPANLEAAPWSRHLTLGLVARIHALAGDLEDARRVLAGMDSLAAVEDFVPAGVGHEVRAIIALHEGRAEDGLEYLRQSRQAEFGLLHHSARFLLGEAYNALGRFTEAAGQYDTVAGTYGLNFNDLNAYAPLRPLAHERAGSAYLAAGDTAAALLHMAAFVELWQQADPALQSRVTRVRDLMRRLVDGGN